LYFSRSTIGLKLSQLINYPLGLLGLKIVRRAKWQLVNTIDIDQDKKFMSVYEKVKPFTMVELERCYALYQSVQYIIKNNIPGDLVECGVWKGGSAMLMLYTLMEAGITDRKIYLYDTFEGMTKPGEMDGENEMAEWEASKITDTVNNMCYASIDEVKANMERTGYPAANIIFIKGKVEDTIPNTLPGSISVLRLDTDWYASTRHELQYLYPLLSQHGVLLVDDYGAWQGARKAVDEYFNGHSNIFLHRVDWTGRLHIKA
jgi:hypothetical protein